MSWRDYSAVLGFSWCKIEAISSKTWRRSNGKTISVSKESRGRVVGEEKVVNIR
jgi:hypothetical protein